jgi:hypothetical protein
MSTECPVSEVACAASVQRGQGRAPQPARRLTLSPMLQAVVVAFSAAIVAAPAAAQTTRHQVSKTNPTGQNDVGIRYFNGTFDVGYSAGDAAYNAVASDGYSLLMFDQSEYNARLMANAGLGPAHYGSAELRLPFVGTGLDVLQINDTVGESYDWEIVTSGSNNEFQVVSSGTVSTYAASGPVGQKVTLAAQGTLTADKIYMLRLKVNDSDGLHGGQGGKWRAIIDAFDVYDESPLTFDDDSNFSGNWNYVNPSLWDIGLGDSPLYEGTRSGSAGAGEKLDIKFTGTAFALYGFNWGGITGVYDWAVDGGLGGSGTVDQTLDLDVHGFAVRWPELVVNGLSSGEHTLSITLSGSSAGGAIPTGLGYNIFDALAVYDSGVVIQNDADFNGDGSVDGADFLIWQRGFGSGSTLQQGDANGDSIVNVADLDVWKTQFGAAATSVAAAVPEPATGVIGLVGLSLLACLRNRRQA